MVARCRGLKLFGRWSLLAVCLLAPVVTSASIAVLYPEVKDPYRKIFLDILGGIRDVAREPVNALALNGSHDAEAVQTWMQENNASAIIALGNKSSSLAKELPKAYPTITGASILSDKNIADGVVGISLTPSPAKLFEKAREFTDKLKKIHVIYHAATNEWLVSLAKASASEQGLELIAHRANDVREAAAFYETAFEDSKAGDGAIWLLQGDPTLDERSLLPDLLRKAWNKSVIVFSSNPSHVKRGALFSLFPDNEAMGKSLAKKIASVSEGMRQDAEALEDLRIAVNIRTASHLNINISRAKTRDFDLVFPSR